MNEKLKKSFVIVFLVIAPTTIYLLLPKVYSEQISYIWWIGVTLILVGLPFLTLLHLLGYKISFKFKGFEIKKNDK